MSEKGKPPIGLMPKKIWRHNRMEDLVLAIDRYVGNGYINGVFGESVIKWCDELKQLILEENK